MSAFIDQLIYECKARERQDKVGVLAVRFDRDTALAELAQTKAVRTDLDEAMQARIQEAFERREDRDDGERWDDRDSNDAGIPCRGEI